MHLPTSDPTPATLMRMIRELQAEVAILKQRERKEYNPSQHRTEITFAMHGSDSVGQRSGAYQIKDSKAVIQRVDWVATEGIILDPGGGT